MIGPNTIAKKLLLFLLVTNLASKGVSFVVPNQSTRNAVPCIYSTEPQRSIESNKILNPFNDNKVTEVDEFIASDFALPSEETKDGKPLGIWPARAILLAIAVIWGTNFAAVKYLETLCFHPPCVHPPSEAALARFGIASAVSLPLLVGQRKDIIFAGFECGAWIALGYITQAVALASIPAGKCAFICSLTVVVVPLISAVFFGKPIKPLNLVAAAVALSGVAILEGMVDTSSIVHAFQSATGSVVNGASSAKVHSVNPIAIVKSAKTVTEHPTLIQTLASKLGVGKGDIVALGQPFGFGLAFMRIEHYVEKFQEEKNQILTLSAAQCVTVGLISLLWVMYDFHGHIPNMEYMVRVVSYSKH